MCGIAGVLSKLGSDVTPHVMNMLSCMSNRGPDGAGVCVKNSIAHSYKLSDLRLNQFNGDIAIGHTRLAIVGGVCGLQPFRSCDGKILLEHNGEIYNYKKLRRELESSHHFGTQTDSEVLVHLIEEYYNGDLLKALKKAVRRLDGVYAIAVKDDKSIVIVRDKLGIRQLYYGENDECIAFASEKKALWMIGVKNVHRVMPGFAVRFLAGKTKIEKLIEPPIRPRGRQVTDMKSAIKMYRKALYRAVEKRVEDLDKVGIIFSGGIDSVLIAKIAKDLGVPDLRCYTAGLMGSHDLKYAHEVAEELGLPLKSNELTVTDIESMLPKIIEVIEDTNAGQVEVAIPVYAAVELAHKDGFKVMLTGQGADELFGGYPWYSKIVGTQGYDEFNRCMVKDLLYLYKESFEREDKIAMAHSIESRIPFLDPQVIRVAMRIDPKLKIFNGNDVFGKHVHRELAEEIGIPKTIAFRPKEAAQHGSGIHDIIDIIARKKGFTKELVRKANYNSVLSKREKIGSSQRYGYLFGDEDLWIAEDHVQMYLDHLAHKHGLVELENAHTLI